MEAGDRAPWNRQEKLAVVSLLAFGAGFLWIAWRLFLAGKPITGNAASLFFLAFWMGYFFFVYRDKSVFADERDKRIGAVRLKASYLSLLVALMTLFLLLDLGLVRMSPPIYSTAWTANFILWLITGALTVHAFVGVHLYWRDRR